MCTLSTAFSGCSSEGMGKKDFTYYVDMFYLYIEMGTGNFTKMLLIYQDALYLSLFIASPTIDWTVINLTATNYIVICQKLWVLIN